MGGGDTAEDGGGFTYSALMRVTRQTAQNDFTDERLRRSAPTVTISAANREWVLAVPAVSNGLL